MQKLDYPSIGETLYRDTLPNGLRLAVLTKPGYTRSFAFFATNYGGADRRFRLGDEFIETPLGVAHFLEHKMFDMPDGDNALATLAKSGAQPNAYTSLDLTGYHFESTENFDTNLRTLLRFVSTPYFTEESVAKEQGIIGQEIRMCEDDPDTVIWESMMRALYAHHPVRNSIVGTIDSIARITPETLYNCHRVFYNPGNMCLAVVGDVDPEAVRAAALEVLPDYSGEQPVRDYGEPEPPEAAETRFTRAMAVSAPQMLIGFKLTPGLRGEELLRQQCVAALARDCLYGPASPFYTRLYAKGLLNADFSCSLDCAAGTATLLAGGESRDPEAVLAEMLAEARAVAESGPERDFFERRKKAAYGKRIRQLSSFGAMCGVLADAEFQGYGALDAISVTASVTAQEVRDFAAEALRPERAALGVITPPAR